MSQNQQPDAQPIEPTRCSRVHILFEAYITCSRIDYILDHKSGLNKYKKIEIIPCIFLSPQCLKLEANDKKKIGNTTNSWKLKNILLKNESVNQEIKKAI